MCVVVSCYSQSKQLAHKIQVSLAPPHQCSQQHWHYISIFFHCLHIHKMGCFMLPQIPVFLYLALHQSSAEAFDSLFLFSSFWCNHLQRCFFLYFFFFFFIYVIFLFSHLRFFLLFLLINFCIYVEIYIHTHIYNNKRVIDPLFFHLY